MQQTYHLKEIENKPVKSKITNVDQCRLNRVQENSISTPVQLLPSVPPPELYELGN